MAQELTLGVTYRFSKGGVRLSRNSAAVSDVNGNVYYDSVQPVGTSNEALNLGETSGEGVVVLRNLDETNFVDIFRDALDAEPILTLHPGDVATFRRKSGVSYYATADTAEVRIQVVAFDA